MICDGGMIRGDSKKVQVPTRFELMLVESKPTVITNYTMGPPILVHSGN